MPWATARARERECVIKDDMTCAKCKRTNIWYLCTSLSCLAWVWGKREEKNEERGGGKEEVGREGKWGKITWTRVGKKWRNYQTSWLLILRISYLPVGKEKCKQLSCRVSKRDGKQARVSALVSHFTRWGRYNTSTGARGCTSHGVRRTNTSGDVTHTRTPRGLHLKRFPHDAE